MRGVVSELAIYVSKQSNGLGKEIGDWAEGVTNRGPFVACTHNNLFTALRFLMVQERLAQLRATLPEIDSALMESQIQRIRTSIDRVKTINRKVSDVRVGAQDIQSEAEYLRDEVRDALTSIEEVLRKAKQSSASSPQAPTSVLANRGEQPSVI
jgi:methyl-accepting chemotaxis protein